MTALRAKVLTIQFSFLMRFLCFFSSILTMFFPFPVSFMQILLGFIIFFTLESLVMKKLFPSIALVMLWSIVLLFYACDKKDLQNTTHVLSESKKIAGTINSWLDFQKSRIVGKSVENIDLLKRNLDFDQYHYEALYDNKRLLIIPIKKALAIEKSIDPNRSYNLVAIVDQSNNIVSARVVIFKPDNQSINHLLPDKTFSNLYNSLPLDVDGQFRFLHIAGNLLYLMDVNNGRPVSWGRYKTKNKTSAEGISLASTKCTNYYLVMTYYENGKVVKETWTYIGQVCETEGCGNDYETFCSPGGGGSGGGEVGEECCIPDPNIRVSVDNTPSDYTMYCGLENIDPVTSNPIKSCDVSWFFSTNNLLWFTWKYMSNELAVFVKENGTWKFKSFQHRSMSKTGSAPPCIIADCIINNATPSIDGGRLMARMNLTFTSSITYCGPFSTPSYQSFVTGRNFTHRG